MHQPELGKEEPNYEPNFDGAHYDPALDHKRLSNQLKKIVALMSDHKWRTVDLISELTGVPHNSTQALLRDLRKEKRGSYDVQSRRVKETGLFEYMVGEKGAGAPKKRLCKNCEEIQNKLDKANAFINELLSKETYEQTTFS